MKIINPLQLNDLNIRSFLKIILAIQLALWGAIGLDAIGLQIPIIRQLIGFIYLTFIPGIIILRILKLHKLGNIETPLYTIGLSITTLMFTGLLMNMVYPFFGISRPISTMPLIITISILVLILCILSYVRDKDFSNPSYVDIKDALSPPLLFLSLIPFLAILGTYLVNFHKNNILLLFLILVVVLVVLLITFDRFIPKNLYPLAISMVSIALLWHNSLISMYLTGFDIHTEYYFSELVKESSYWDWTIPSTYNAMLSDTVLPTIYSYLLDIDAAWIFKIICPFLFSLVPLALYRVYQKQTDEKIAFFSVFFFISLGVFYGLVMSLAKQQISLFFLVLLILLIQDKEMNATKRIAMIIIFSTSLIVSHYGTSYIYMFYILFTWLALSFMGNTTVNNFRQSLHAKFNRYKEKRMIPQDDNAITNMDRPILKDTKIITWTFMMLYFVMALSWYMYISNSVTFETIVNIGNHIYTTMGDMFTPATMDPNVLKMLGLKQTASFEHDITRFLYQITQFFIVVGVIELIVKPRGIKIEREYVAMTLISMILILMCIVLPYFASSFVVSRFYIITLLFLSPFCILGGETVFSGILKLFHSLASKIRDKSAHVPTKSSYTNQNGECLYGASTTNKIHVILVCMVLIPYFLFNVGFVYEITGDVPSSISLSMESMKKSTDPEVRVIFSGVYTYEYDVFSAKWLSKSRDNKKTVYSDILSYSYLLPSYGMIMQPSRTLGNNTWVLSKSYVYLSHLNVVNGIMYLTGYNYNTTEISPPLWGNNKIYTNGCSEIHYYK